MREEIARTRLMKIQWVLAPNLVAYQVSPRPRKCFLYLAGFLTAIVWARSYRLLKFGLGVLIVWIGWLNSMRPVHVCLGTLEVAHPILYLCPN